MVMGKVEVKPGPLLAILGLLLLYLLLVAQGGGGGRGEEDFPQEGQHSQEPAPLFLHLEPWLKCLW